MSFDIVLSIAFLSVLNIMLVFVRFLLIKHILSYTPGCLFSRVAISSSLSPWGERRGGAILYYYVLTDTLRMKKIT